MAEFIAWIISSILEKKNWFHASYSIVTTIVIINMLIKFMRLITNKGQ